MKRLLERIITLYPEIEESDYDPIYGYIEIRDEKDGNGERITKWTHPTIQRPSNSQLEAVEILPPAYWTISSREFLEKFTDDEYRSIRNSSNMSIQRRFDELVSMRSINLRSVLVKSSIESFYAEGILTEERKNEILTPEFVDE